MTAEEIRYLELTPDTVPLLERGAEALFDNPIRPASLAAFLGDANHLLWFAVHGERPVGFASGTVLFHPDNAPQLFINEVEVLESHRRQGIGRALVARLVDVARDRGCDFAWLGTASDNIGSNACFGSVPGAENGGSFVLYEWELTRRGA